MVRHPCPYTLGVLEFSVKCVERRRQSLTGHEVVDVLGDSYRAAHSLKQVLEHQRALVALSRQAWTAGAQGITSAIMALSYYALFLQPPVVA